MDNQANVVAAQNIPRAVLTSVIGTSLDKGDELDALAKTLAREQQALAARAATGPSCADGAGGLMANKVLDWNLVSD